MTIHRPENADSPSRLRGIFSAVQSLSEPVVVPLHPRTRKTIQVAEIRISGPKIILTDPLGYLDMIRLASAARLILTDSGGVQKEAYWLGVPCITLRDETEWVETVMVGWNRLAGADPDCIRQLVHTFYPPALRPILYGDGYAAERCVEILSTEVKSFL
jgi:UDP-N-acetylglucosamine 2-epimerase